jgi:hypothetical protein
MKNLVAISIEDAAISNAGVAHLKAFTKLQELSIFRCYGITDAGLAPLAELKDIKRLSFRDTAIEARPEAHSRHEGLAATRIERNATNDDALRTSEPERDARPLAYESHRRGTRTRALKLTTLGINAIAVTDKTARSSLECLSARPPGG